MAVLHPPVCKSLHRNFSDEVDTLHCVERSSTKVMTRSELEERHQLSMCEKDGRPCSSVSHFYTFLKLSCIFFQITSVVYMSLVFIRYTDIDATEGNAH